MALGVWGGGDVVGVVVGALGGVAGLEGGGLGGWVVAGRVGCAVTGHRGELVGLGAAGGLWLVRVGWGVVGLVGPCRFVAAG